MSRRAHQSTVAAEMVHANGRGKCVVDLGRDTYHGLRLIGDCEITFANGEDGFTYQLAVRQDNPGGRRATFPNLNTERGEQLHVAQEVYGATYLEVSCAGGGYYLTGASTT